MKREMRIKERKCPLVLANPYSAMGVGKYWTASRKSITTVRKQGLDLDKKEQGSRR